MPKAVPLPIWGKNDLFESRTQRYIVFRQGDDTGWGNRLRGMVASASGLDTCFCKGTPVCFICVHACARGCVRA